MPNNTPIPEIPIQDNREPVAATITLKPDVDDFLKQHEQGRGDRTHVINAIIRVYRDSLPVNRRGPLTIAKQSAPSQSEPETATNTPSHKPNGVAKHATT